MQSPRRRMWKYEDPARGDLAIVRCALRAIADTPSAVSSPSLPSRDKNHGQDSMSLPPSLSRAGNQRFIHPGR